MFDYNFPTNQEVTLRVYSLIGSLVREIEFTSASGTIRFGTEKFIEGFYFYKLLAGNAEITSGKFIVNH
jgi:hypothetical protein